MRHVSPISLLGPFAVCDAVRRCRRTDGFRLTLVRLLPVRVSRGVASAARPVRFVFLRGPNTFRGHENGVRATTRGATYPTRRVIIKSRRFVRPTTDSMSARHIV